MEEQQHSPEHTKGQVWERVCVVKDQDGTPRHWSGGGRGGENIACRKELPLASGAWLDSVLMKIGGVQVHGATDGARRKVKQK